MASDSSAAAAFGGLWPPGLWRPLGSPQQLKSQPKSSRWFKPAIGVFSSTSTSASSRFIFVLNANPPPLKFCTGASSSSSSLSAQAGVCDGSSSSAYDAACLCVSLALQGQTQELRYREIHVRPPAVGKEDSKRNAPFVIECETPEHSKRLMEVLDGRIVHALGDKPLAAWAALEPTTAAKDERPKLPTSTDVRDLGVPGIALVENFVTAAEERELLAFLGEDGTWESLAKRCVRHYGYAFRYATSDVAESPDRSWPDAIAHLAHRVGAMCKSGVAKACSYGDEDFDVSTSFDQVTVNDYPAGVGIAPHVDTPRAFGPTLASVSLGSSCVFEMIYDTNAPGYESRTRRRSAGDARNDDDGEPVFTRRRLLVPRRSLLVLSGSARNEWSHSVPSHKSDDVNGVPMPRSRRVSLTLRDVAGAPERRL
ncbi:alkB-like protein [Pycnococcus provasolii]